MVKQYQKTKHMTVAGTITNGLVIWFSGTPSAVGANWKNDAPEAVLIASATFQGFHTGCKTVKRGYISD